MFNIYHRLYGAVPVPVPEFSLLVEGDARLNELRDAGLYPTDAAPLIVFR